MEQTNLILNLSAEGLRPSKIAETTKVPLDVVIQELINAIKTRRIKRSQVLATLHKEWQEQISAWVKILDKKKSEKKQPEILIKIIFNVLKDSNGSDFDLTMDEFNLYLVCYEKPFEDGEIYESLCEIERTLHAKIKAILREKHGDRWWKTGIPLSVREECATRSEKDSEFFGYPAYDYVTLGELKMILQIDSKLFKARLPCDPIGKEPNMELISKSLDRLTRIRNKVMHPIGAIPPNEDDFFFVREMKAKFDLTKWR